MPRAQRTLFAAAALMGAVTGCGAGEPTGGPVDPREGPRWGSVPSAPRGEPGLVRAQNGPRVTTVATGLNIPWDIAFLPDGRALVTERPGRVRLLSAEGRLQDRPVANIAVRQIGEGGLLGVAVDPQFAENRFVYLYRTTSNDIEIGRYRFTEDGGLSEQATVARGITVGAIHDSGRLHFGPDGRLYFTTGDAGRPGLAQRRGSLNGKMLRLDPAEFRGRGGRPEVFSLGHRNSQGFDWQPGTNALYAAEHGQTGNDEINLLRRGGNYGWPIIEGRRARRGLIRPRVLYPGGIAPSGATFVSRPGSSWTGDFLVAGLRGRQIRRVTFRRGRAVRNVALLRGRLGRVRTVVEAPDGGLYVLTSNRDGRGSPRAGDDRIVRIVPPRR